ncbi:hypothetical protein LMOSLCC2479_2633 [Listeria monocytogenes SLCC2479]|nr:hypothetical protein LM5578_2765 [Listeria monocytogenes 08-5578]ADB72555.1 hypothetical protein LM5923_2714 [Listeria monocytogenes 08-5923]ASG98230.1 hypothetical protein N883_2802 [Listeria monocytogenes serotype 1/2a str. 01-5252]ASH85879.1 hypothetical protein N882_2851 [Listeria monocytogenes serotype 1/2a str. 01-1468]EAL05482.1 hypothetical protein LMOf6854_2630 [Listeria monocytogenes str. 1/2a F6854] [Listeria monocytogenes serotype 1/2a str. F6854]CBY58904.1 hypothetical protein 
MAGSPSFFLRNQKALTKEEEKYCIKQPEKW